MNATNIGYKETRVFKGKKFQVRGYGSFGHTLNEIDANELAERIERLGKKAKIVKVKRGRLVYEEV